MERSEMIRCLIDATLETALGDPGLGALRAMLENGFAGYAGMSTPGLAREMQLRGLLEFDDPEPAEEFDDDEDAEDEDDDEDERFVMLAGMVALEATWPGLAGERGRTQS